MTIQEFVAKHIERGECQCGKCSDKGSYPEPQGHTVDMIFFKCAKKGVPTVDEFIAFTKAHPCDYGTVDPLDGKEHSYIELGGWIGDQGLAMMYMALGVSLGVFQLLTPRMLRLPEEMVKQMAGMGMLSIIKPIAKGEAKP